MPTLADLFAQYETEYLLDKSPVTRYAQQMFFRQVLRELGPLPLEEVTTDRLRDWKLALSRRCKTGTVHRYLVRLNVVLAVAVEEYHWLAENPLKRLRKPSASAGTVRFLTNDERRALLAACLHSDNRLLYPIVLMALSTGGRKNELRKLCWSEVDMACGIIQFVRTKTSLNRAVPVKGDAWTILQALYRGRTPRVPWVFPCPSEQGPVLIESAWLTARSHSGVKQFRFHDLRHTFASYMAMSGATLREIADVLGHKNIQQTMIYAHLAPNHTAAVVERMTAKFLQTT